MKNQHYYDILPDLSKNQILDLLKTKKIDWDRFLFSKQFYKLHQEFSLNDLEESQLGGVLEKESSVAFILSSLQKNTDIYKLAKEKLISDSFDYKKISQSEVLLKEYLNVYPNKKQELKSNIKLTCDNSFLWINDTLEQIASYINEGRLSVYGIDQMQNQLKSSSSEILIDEKIYEGIPIHSVDYLLKIYPRKTPFSQGLAKKIVEKNRPSFLLLPLKNQAQFELFNFATNHTLYSQSDTDFDRPDPENIPLKKLSNEILEHIAEDQNGVDIALQMIKKNNTNINHPNVKKLVNNPVYAKRFAIYQKLLSPEQKALSQIYTVENVPSTLGDVLPHQSHRVLSSFITKADNIHEASAAFSMLLGDKKELLSMEPKTVAYIFDHISAMISSYGKNLSNEKIENLVDFTLRYHPHDYKVFKHISLITESQKFDKILLRKLGVEDKLGYLDFEDKSEAKKSKFKK